MKPRHPKSRILTALVANGDGQVFELPGYAAVRMAGPVKRPLTAADTTIMPHGGELMRLPDRYPVLYNIETATMETLAENPHLPGEPIFPVAAFNSPGFLLSGLCAYTEGKGAACLPLFSYGAVGWQRGKFRSAVIRVDDEPRQDLRQMPLSGVRAGVERMRQRLPKNRLRAHLEKCALEYGCPAAKNFFLGRFEAPLPTAASCNARCLGCLSLQSNDQIPCSQNRIDFTPDPDEIAAVAVAHIEQVPKAVVSFGQGCEGDPLMAADVIEAAVVLVRRSTAKGTIHMNTNASRPEVLERLFKAGLDSIRVSMNSFRESCYHAYFRPVGYGFGDVADSVALARRQDKFTAVNYLNMPGFTDTPEELGALTAFLRHRPIDMMQWRNLNYDPVRYWRAMTRADTQGKPVGMKTVLRRVQRTFPELRHGYFNPPKEHW